MLKVFVLALAVLVPPAALAAERSIEIAGAQASVPVGLTIQVKSVTVGEDATKVRILASFDSSKTNRVNMNDNENAYLSWGDGDQERLHLRQVADNKWMRIANGQTMEGDLVFPGVIPADAERLSLVFNPGRSGGDTVAPGVTIPLNLKR